MVNDLQNWSPWGPYFAGKPYIQVPHKMIEILARMGFGQTETLVVEIFLGDCRPDRDKIKVSQSQLAIRAGCNPRTVSRTLQRLISHGVEIIEDGALTRRISVYNIEKFREKLAIIAKEMENDDF